MARIKLVSPPDRHDLNAMRAWTMIQYCHIIGRAPNGSIPPESPVPTRVLVYLNELQHRVILEVFHRYFPHNLIAPFVNSQMDTMIIVRAFRVRTPFGIELSSIGPSHRGRTFGLSANRAICLRDSIDDLCSHFFLILCLDKAT